mmetsp:Transcript_10470/g.21177  ORF Transcript_10470/g.21177 Transcript_10470/m.21177 type:complete len:246 (-) Transcript_10470:2010-2747(-)
MQHQRGTGVIFELRWVVGHDERRVQRRGELDVRSTLLEIRLRVPVLRANLIDVVHVQLRAGLPAAVLLLVPLADESGLGRVRNKCHFDAVLELVVIAHRPWNRRAAHRVALGGMRDCHLTGIEGVRLRLLEQDVIAIFRRVGEGVGFHGLLAEGAQLRIGGAFRKADECGGDARVTRHDNTLNVVLHAVRLRAGVGRFEHSRADGQLGLAQALAPSSDSGLMHKLTHVVKCREVVQLCRRDGLGR